ncbi:MAG: hypothetical protein JW837_12100 [Sedimentisphaerales bacterium]|nr:hypothetical protein [Sedimentisphaerales bacterium]
MKRNKKTAILAVLIAVVAFIWMPKGKKPAAVSADVVEPMVSVVPAMPKKRTEFVDCNRDPFVWPQAGEEETDGISDLIVFAITWKGGESEAMIGESVVRVGDKIADKTVKRIEKDRVILTDGVKDYVLKL